MSTGRAPGPLPPAHGLPARPPMSTRQTRLEPGQLSAVVLAGGRGRRMGGVDKGLRPLAGRPMVAWVLERLRPQAGTVRVCANRNLAAYAELGCEVFSDPLPDFQGPLAGMLGGLREAPTAWVQFAPCDTPGLPMDLSRRLAAAALRTQASLAVPRAAGRLQPVCALARRGAAAGLQAFLEAGGRRVEDWLAGEAAVTVDFDDPGTAFCNINTPAEAAAWAAGRSTGTAQPGHPR